MFNVSMGVGVYRYPLPVLTTHRAHRAMNEFEDTCRLLKLAGIQRDTFAEDTISDQHIY